MFKELDVTMTTVFDQALGVQRVDIQRINHCLVDSVVYFEQTYPLDSDLYFGLRYPAFVQLGPACFHFVNVCAFELM